MLGGGGAAGSEARCMDMLVVAVAQQDQIVERRGPSVDPMSNVVGMAEGGWCITAGGDTSTIASYEGSAKGGWYDPSRSSDIEHLGLAAQNGGKQFGVTRHLSEQSG